MVASTGNDGYAMGISWPACVPRVVKASGVRNDGVGSTKAILANSANPSFFPGDFMFFGVYGADASGGTAILSSANVLNNDTGMLQLSGTSQAAPMISGLYGQIKAAVPAITVDDASAWIRDAGSVPIAVQACNVGPCAPADVFLGRRVRIPNF